MTTRLQRAAMRVTARAGRMPRLTRVARHPLVARTGYGLATAAGLLWGAALSTGRIEQVDGLVVTRGLPRWAFGRGGTTIGGVYLTRDNLSPGVLAHEAVHREQWRQYGLAFALLYAAAGPDAATNRFEVEAGLMRGGYGPPMTDAGR